MISQDEKRLYGKGKVTKSYEYTYITLYNEYLTCDTAKTTNKLNQVLIIYIHPHISAYTYLSNR